MDANTLRGCDPNHPHNVITHPSRSSRVHSLCSVGLNRLSFTLSSLMLLCKRSQGGSGGQHPPGSSAHLRTRQQATSCAMVAGSRGDRCTTDRPVLAYILMCLWPGSDFEKKWRPGHPNRAFGHPGRGGPVVSKKMEAAPWV